MIVAERRAEARGEARGRCERKRASAKTMREKGMSPEDIAEITGLTAEEMADLEVGGGAEATVGKGPMGEEDAEAYARVEKHMRSLTNRFAAPILDPVMVDRYNTYVEASHEEVSRRIVAERRAEARGRALGEARGRYEQNRANARAMRKKGMSPEDISDITGLSVEEVAGL